MLRKAVKKQLESDYDMSIMEIKYLSKGSNGCVCRVKCDSGESYCVKMIPKENSSVKSECTISPVMYNTDAFKVRIYFDELHYYIITPFFVGENLASVILLNIAVEKREAIFANLIVCVEEMHKKGILHRDLKPENIIVNLDDNTVKIIDCGRAVAVFDDKSGKALSTPEDLSLKSTNNAWYAFFPITQYLRRWQPQTAPEYTSTMTHYYNYKCEAEGVGFRSDYYAVANLFLQLLPEHPEFKDMINEVLKTDGLDRSRTYHDFVKKFLHPFNIRLSMAELPFAADLPEDIAGAACAPSI